MITITKGTQQLAFTTISFPAGELGVRLDTANYRFQMANGNPTQTTVTARIQNHRDFMELVMVTDALTEWDRAPEKLVLPTMPNARQDRPCCEGEAFGLLAFARQIGALGYKHLITFDQHSDVTFGVFQALGLKTTVIDRQTILGRFDALNARIVGTTPGDRPLLVSPDAGANKTVSAIAGHYGHERFVRADKLRDLATGRIKEIVVVNPREDIEGRDCLILDDLADGAATFIGLATALKAKGARRVELYVTHGIWSRGLDHLWDGGIDHIWATNSYRTDTEKLTARSLDRLTVLQLEEVFSL